MIQEIILTTRNAGGGAHMAPMGIHELDGFILIRPYKPSLTLENIRREQTAVVNRADDARIFAGCLTGRKDWPLCPAERIDGSRLEAALSHLELKLERLEDDEIRPRCYCRPVHEAMHRPFQGFNRAQAAVLEAAILVSRLDRLPAQKVEREIARLSIAIDKTAGDRERTAWDWLMEAIKAFDGERRDKTA